MTRVSSLYPDGIGKQENDLRVPMASETPSRPDKSDREQENSVADEELSELSRYGHIRAWAKTTGLSDTTILHTLRGAPWVLGIDEYGKQRKFYAEEEVREKLRKLFNAQTLPQANENGFLEIKGEWYAGIRILCKELKIAHRTLLPLLLEVDQFEGKYETGHISIVYNVEQVRSTLEKKKKTWANAEGFLEREGRQYVHREGLQRKLGGHLPHKLLKGVKVVEGQNSRGATCSFYSLKDIEDKVASERESCINAEGILEKSGKHYGHQTALMKELGISETTLAQFLVDVEQITGKNMRRVPTILYDMEAVRRKFDEDRQFWANAEGILERGETL